MGSCKLLARHIPYVRSLLSTSYSYLCGRKGGIESHHSAHGAKLDRPPVGVNPFNIGDVLHVTASVDEIALVVCSDVLPGIWPG